MRTDDKSDIKYKQVVSLLEQIHLMCGDHESFEAIMIPRYLYDQTCSRSQLLRYKDGREVTKESDLGVMIRYFVLDVKMDK